MGTVANTKTGCRVGLHESPIYVEHMGNGLMLTLDMAVTNDPRHAEVYLDDDAALAIYRTLKAYLTKRNVGDSDDER